MRTQSNKTFSRPLEAYPELMNATTEQRNDYVIGDDGEDIRWVSLDADMHISSFLETSEPKENEIGELFAKYPWLNISEVARSLNINKSLLARYIYGISKPSEKSCRDQRSPASFWQGTPECIIRSVFSDSCLRLTPY